MPNSGVMQARTKVETAMVVAILVASCWNLLSASFRGRGSKVGMHHSEAEYMQVAQGADARPWRHVSGHLHELISLLGVRNVVGRRTISTLAR